MRDYKIILFDLDGTLSDPKIGITKSVQYALGKMGVIEPNLDKLEPFIGPPLQESFSTIYQFTNEQVSEAIKFYRERFVEKGMFENEMYSNIPELLKELKGNGYELVVATSKPTVFAEQILKYFEIEAFFSLVVGSNLDGTRIAKGEIIQYILDQYPEFVKDNFIMIGDRKHDMIGANQVGIDCIGVTYGYGSEEELTRASSTFIVHNELDILNVVNKHY
ncbi:HAD family hydrolase [Bacillus sp. 31A1R]|uniref:HAD family hydrolase n=1 Tax=Robertmurraya mangrovi TaxID=3098077 RepID=A0ABU5IVS7_9BACI|nr:HAD family hydrolase [Bacillus sp. 31A1R]MDZ5471239.1 HAD family hydrolase [Bacillus sp. 31A1R]